MSWSWQLLAGPLWMHRIATTATIKCSLAGLLPSCISGCSALHFAAFNGNEKVIELLLAAGSPSSIRAIDSDHRTALHYAAREGHERAVALMLAYEPDLILATDRSGNTPLHLAAIKGCGRFVAQLQQQLLQLHQQEHCQQQQEQEQPERERVVLLNQDNKTPFDIAVANGNDSAADSLQCGLSFDEIVHAYTASHRTYAERLRPIVEAQCESLLVASFLNRDVVGTVYEYLGFDYVKRVRYHV